MDEAKKEKSLLRGLLCLEVSYRSTTGGSSSTPETLSLSVLILLLMISFFLSDFYKKCSENPIVLHLFSTKHVTDNISDQLVKIVELLAAKQTNNFSEKMVGTKAELKEGSSNARIKVY